MTKKRVLFVGSFKSKSSTGHVGGQMFACTSLINSRLQQEVEFYTIDTTASTNKVRSFFSRAIGAASRILKFLYLLLTRRIDTVLVFCSNGWSFKEKGMMILIAKFFRKKAIIAPRSGHLLKDISQSKKFKAFSKNVFEKSDYIICQGTPWKDFFRQTFELKKLKLIVLHNWIDINKQPNRTKDTSNRLDVLFLGWIDRAKGVYDILEVAEALKDQDIFWTIAGNGNEFEALQTQIKEKNLEKVSLPGWRVGPEKAKLFKQTDVFLLPSYAEGLPNAVLEAINHHIPVITTTVGALPDVIEDGENGFLIEPGDTEALRQKIMRLHNNADLRNQFAEKSFSKLKNNHSIENAIETFQQLF